MNRITLSLLLLLSTGLWTSLVAQSVQINHNNGRTYDFNATSQNPSPAVLHIFKDGYFSQQPNVTHEFWDDGTYATETYIVEDKTDNPPATAVPVPAFPSATVNTPVTGNPPGSSSISPFMGNRVIRVDRSWNPALNHSVIMIVSFTHPDQLNPSAPPVDGDVYLYLDPGVTFQGSTIYPENPSPVPVAWADYRGVQPPTTVLGTGTTTLKWEYTNLKYGEIRHLYVKVEIPNSFSSARVKTGVELTTNSEACNGQFCSIYSERRFQIARFPHDPNEMWVDQVGIKANAQDRQRLDYGVRFTNDAEYYAQDVLVEVQIDDLDFTGYDLQITDSSFPCSVVADPIAGKFSILFDDIFLPGERQIFPHDYHDSDCVGFVEFSICAPDHQPNGFIGGVSEVFFDTLPGITTNTVQTIVEDPWQLGADCDFLEQQDFDDYGLQADDGPARPQADRRETLSVDALTVWPNPTTHELQLETDITAAAGSQVSISLFAIDGSLLLHRDAGYQPAGTFSTQLDLSELPVGIYQVIVRQDDRIQTTRVIKQ